MTRSLTDLKKYHLQFRKDVTEVNNRVLRRMNLVTLEVGIVNGAHAPSGGILVGVHVRRTDYVSFRYQEFTF